ncbi:hypothetical protein [Bradyrhizobium sp. Tv2a-2]|uniref:hypothetical protein n=1 Tax=Bradyrhizobium sp. Tv2a-2 TaxID=113395 RepID=UPI0004035335|nr:hypothetical protein [Bradyrhizobium sp. Tv2a-2]
MRAFYAELDANKKDQIAGRQLQILQNYQRTRAKKLWLSDATEVFELIKDVA